MGRRSGPLSGQWRWPFDEPGGRGRLSVAGRQSRWPADDRSTVRLTRRHLGWRLAQGRGALPPPDRHSDERERPGHRNTIPLDAGKKPARSARRTVRVRSGNAGRSVGSPASTAARLAGVGEEQDHAPQPDRLPLERDHPRRSLRVVDARDGLDPGPVPGPREHGVDGASVRPIRAHRDLGPPGPAVVEDAAEPSEEPQLPRVAQRRAARVGTHRHVQPDGCAVSCQERRVDRLQPPMLHQPDELPRTAQGSGETGHRAAACQPGVAAVVEDVMDLGPCPPAGCLDLVARGTHGADRDGGVLTGRVSAGYRRLRVVGAPASRAGRSTKKGRRLGRRSRDASVVGLRTDGSRLRRRHASQIGHRRESGPGTKRVRSGCQPH